jgi:hypothetical protein
MGAEVPARGSDRGHGSRDHGQEDHPIHERRGLPADPAVRRHGESGRPHRLPPALPGGREVPRPIGKKHEERDPRVLRAVREGSPPCPDQGRRSTLWRAQVRQCADRPGQRGVGRGGRRRLSVTCCLRTDDRRPRLRGLCPAARRGALLPASSTSSSRLEWTSLPLVRGSPAACHGSG